MEKERPQWPIVSKAETFVVGLVLAMVVSMAFIANMNKSNVLSSVFTEQNPYVELSCNQLIEKMNQKDEQAIDEFEGRCLNHKSESTSRKI